MTWSARRLIATADEMVSKFDKYEHAIHEQRGAVGSATVAIELRKGEPEVRINWSACGAQDLEATKSFMATLTYCHDLVCELNSIFAARKLGIKHH